MNRVVARLCSLACYSGIQRRNLASRLPSRAIQSRPSLGHHGQVEADRDFDALLQMVQELRDPKHIRGCGWPSGIPRPTTTNEFADPGNTARHTNWHAYLAHSSSCMNCNMSCLNAMAMLLRQWLKKKLLATCLREIFLWIDRKIRVRISTGRSDGEIEACASELWSRRCSC